MAVFDFIKDLFVSRSPSKDQKYAAAVRNPKAIKEDRWSALQYFQDHPEMQTSVEALLPRFDFSLEHGILDTREKELAMKGITRFGANALPIVQEQLKKTSRIAWPIKIIKELGNEEIVVDALVAALNYSDVSFDHSQTDKNYDVLCHLVDFKLSESRWKKLLHFFKDPDERVRFAVVEVLIEQNFNETADVLEKVLSDETGDNSRIRQTVVNAYIERQWKVKNPAVFPEGHVVGPVFVGKNSQLELR